MMPRLLFFVLFYGIKVRMRKAAMTKESQIRIIFSDIDGTLLPFEGKDLSATAALIADLIRAGYVFVPCTGRGTGNIPPQILSIPGLRYVITANGALVTDLADSRVLYNKTLSRGLASKLLAFLRRYDGTPFSYRRGIHFIDSKSSCEPLRAAAHSLRDWVDHAAEMRMEDYLAEAESDYVDKIGFACLDQALRERVMEDVRREPFYDELFVTTSGPWNVEFNAAGANKGLAAAWLTGHLGLPPSSMLAAGDNFNDLPMLETAAVSLAPANAEPAVKARASVVVPDCREDGVEKYLMRFLP